MNTTSLLANLAGFGPGFVVGFWLATRRARRLYDNRPRHAATTNTQERHS